jgi:asparagine synthase (glutamine-hydrolysing)
MSDRMTKYSQSWFLVRIAPPGEALDRPDSGDPFLARQVGDRRIEIRPSSIDLVAADDHAGVTVLLHGDEYTRAGSPEALLRAYVAEGESLFGSLNGSYAIVVVDERRGQVLAVTDRFTSRKVFHSAEGGSHWLSSTLALHPSTSHPLDPVGIGSLLACGVAHSDLTPFLGIRKLRPASVYRFSGGVESSESYWSWRVAEGSQSDPTEVKSELIDVMRSAVARRVGDSGDVYVSLSGGYDSRAVVGLLTEIIDDIGRIHSFTYNHGAPHGDTDARAAAAVADQLGLKHRLVEAYRGNLIETLAANSAGGQGIANFCLEVDAWQAMRPAMAKSEDSVLFVADIPGMAVAPKGGTPESVLASVDIYPISTIESFLSQLEPEVSAELRNGWGDAYWRLRTDAATVEDSRVGHDHLYLSQRLSNTLMLWRECFQMPLARVANPFLDNTVVDLMLSLPVEFREMKVLYREAIAEAFPALFTIPVSPGGWNSPDWARELRENSGAIRDLLDTPSRLDELIPPEAIAAWLDHGLAPQTARGDVLAANLRRAVGMSEPLRRVVRAVKPKVQPAVRRTRPWDRLMLDLLSLRGFLSKDL